MSFRRTLKLGPFSYTVVEKAELSVNGLQGLMHRTQGLIELSPLQPKAEWQDTLLHECLHACWERAGLPSTVDDDDLEEEVVRRLTPWLLMAVKQNKWLLEALA